MAKNATKQTPKYDGTLEFTDDGPQPTLQDVLKAFAGMKQWAGDFATFVDDLADVLQRCDARLAMYPDVTGLREQVNSLAQQVAGLAARTVGTAPGAPVMSNNNPGSVDQYLYHATKPSRRVRTAARLKESLAEGYQLTITAAATLADGSVDAALMSQIHGRGAEEDTRRPEPLVPQPVAQAAEGQPSAA